MVKCPHKELCVCITLFIDNADDYYFSEPVSVYTQAGGK